ncbi:MAG TPA: hypothetical protein VMU84_15965 [Thermoanaerobaculia bacterium]|nr:hypothetical protein [Thermoanaerobaculia bacterium]
MKESRHPYLQRTRRLFRTRKHDESEIAGYIHAFTQSSDRVRQIIFVITTFCILIFVANWNTNPASWARSRMRKAVEQELLRRTTPMPSQRLPTDRQQALQAIYNEQVLRYYPQKYVEDVLLIEIPAVGISTDVNELGILGGVSLWLMMFILLRALKRQHENLYLSIFKIRRLFERDGQNADGESRANYLYHSLAMSQVLSTPPTLARWEIQRGQQHVRFLLKLTFVVPAALQVWVASSNYLTANVPRFYFGRMPTWKLGSQFALALLLFLFGFACFLYSRAIDKRWRGVFFLINPGHKAMQAAPWAVWVKLRSRWSRGEKSLRLELENALRTDRVLGGTADAGCTEIQIVERLAWPDLTRKTFRTGSHHLIKAARAHALRWCSDNGHHYIEMQEFTIKSRRLADKVLKVEMAWRFKSTPRRRQGERSA